MAERQVSSAFLDGLYQAIRKRAEGMAPHFRPGYDAKGLDGDELETLWNRRAMPVEQEWELHRARQPDGVTPLYTREQIGLMVFPDREKLIKSGGRVEPREWIQFANAAAKRMAARREARATIMPVEGSLTDGVV